MQYIRLNGQELAPITPKPLPVSCHFQPESLFLSCRSYSIVVVMRKRRAPTREGMVVTTVAMPPDLHEQLAIAAVKERAAMTELIRQAVKEWLERREKKQKGI